MEGRILQQTDSFDQTCKNNDVDNKATRSVFANYPGHGDVKPATNVEVYCLLEISVSCGR